MIELILVAGLIALFVAHRRASSRIALLQQRIDELVVSSRPSETCEDEEPPAARPSSRTFTPPVEKGVAIATAGEPLAANVEESASKQDDAPPERETFANRFERLVGGRLLIWIGGVALAVAGIFLVRYSIEIGLATPRVRMVAAAIFGALLVAAGEAARRRPAMAGDPRIAQALVGAGILVLYATSYGALELYGLIGLGTAAFLMVAITAGALILSLRHGAPTAVLGLIGGFLTPLLVGDPDSGAVPLLAYLALLNAALFVVARRRGWTWLAAGAVLLSYFWSAALLFDDRRDALAAGLFVVVLGLAGSLARPGEGRQLRRLQPAAIGLVQLAALVARTDLGVAAWALFGTLSAGGLFLAHRDRAFRLLPLFALGLALLLLAVKAIDGTDPLLPYVAGAITLLFAGFAFPRATQEDERPLSTLIACAAIAGPVLILRAGEAGLLAGPAWALLAGLLAIGPATLGWRQRAHARQQGEADGPLLGAAATAALLLVVAAFDLAPPRLLPAAWLAVAIALGLAARKLADRAVAWLAIALAGLGFAAALHRVPELWRTLTLSLLGDPALVTGLPPAAEAFSALLLPSLLLGLLALLLPRWFAAARAATTAVAGFLFASAAYVAFKQVFALETGDDVVARGFTERLILTQFLFATGWLLAARRLSIPYLDPAKIAVAGRVLTMIAAARFVWFDLLIHNPAFAAMNVGSVPLLNLLVPAYFGSACWFYLARRRAVASAPKALWLALFLTALIAGTLLLVRQGFQGAILAGPDATRGELYGYSLAALTLAVALLLAGNRLPDRALRVAGLGLLTVTILKVFLIDAAALEGVLRILSFLGLGIALIGIGKLYGKVLGRPVAGDS